VLRQIRIQSHQGVPRVVGSDVLSLVFVCSARGACHSLGGQQTQRHGSLFADGAKCPSLVNG